MQGAKRLNFLKFEAIIFSLAIIGFMVMYYFKLIDKELLGVTTLMMSACVFSANASIQAWKDKNSVVKLNLYLAGILFAAGLIFAVIFWSTGKLSIF